MAKQQKKVKTKTLTKASLSASLQQIKLNAAGIDISATEHYAAVPADRDQKPVQRFGAFTSD